jgi:DNA polymerase III, delta subunit, C terminal
MMLSVLNALTLTLDRAQLLRSAEELAAAKDRQEYEERLDALETLIRDAWALTLGRPSETIVNVDVLTQLQQIAGKLTSNQAAAWLRQIEDLRGTLEVNINRRVASDALLLSLATR